MMNQMSFEDLIERFVGNDISIEDLADYDWQQLQVDLQEVWGEFTEEIAKDTGCDDWREMAIKITEAAMEAMPDGFDLPEIKHYCYYCGHVADQQIANMWICDNDECIKDAEHVLRCQRRN